MERRDVLLRIPVYHHLLGTAEEVVEVAAALFTTVGNVCCQFRSQIHRGTLDDRIALGIKDSESQTCGLDGGEADDATMSDGGQAI